MEITLFNKFGTPEAYIKEKDTKLYSSGMAMSQHT